MKPRLEGIPQWDPAQIVKTPLVWGWLKEHVKTQEQNPGSSLLDSIIVNSCKVLKVIVWVWTLGIPADCGVSGRFDPKRSGTLNNSRNPKEKRQKYAAPRGKMFQVGLYEWGQLQVVSVCLDKPKSKKPAFPLCYFSAWKRTANMLQDNCKSNIARGCEFYKKHLLRHGKSWQAGPQSIK